MDDDESTETYIRDTSTHLQRIDASLSRLVEVIRSQKLAGSRPSRLEPASPDRSESGSEFLPDEEQDQDDDSQKVECVPEARQCDLEEYLEWVKGESIPVLDYLVAGNELDGEVRAWEERNAAVLTPSPTGIPQEDRQGSIIQPREATMPKDLKEDSWIHSIRINSAIVIRMLRQLSTDEGIAMPQQFEQQPVVFNRPFAFFMHHQAKMKVRLSELRERVESPEESSGMPLDFLHGSCGQETALRQIQCYVDFVEDRVVSETERWTRAAELRQQPPRIRFDDLWYLFQPGDFVYQPIHPMIHADFKTKSKYQCISRVIALQRPMGKSREGGPSAVTYNPVDYWPPPSSSNYDEERNLQFFSACLYYLEFDGECWRPSYRPVHIREFSGEKDITTLPCYPLRFKADWEELLEQGINDGKAMVDLIRERYGFYSGWSLINSPLGPLAHDARGRTIKSPTHIESDVLVDFSEAFNTSPSWRPGGFVEFTPPAISGVTGSIGWRKASHNVEWADTHKTSAELRTRGRVVEWDGVDSVRALSYWQRDQYVRGTRVKMPSGEDFALIPRRFYGYSVWERRFFHLDIRSVQPKDMTDHARAFSQLQIGSDDKQLIQSLVHSHFHKKDFQAKHGIELQGQDLIRGKGKGLVILLHGVPGVGKTATAEAVAQKWQKPLFPITCGDLGITAEKVERALKEIFRLAHLWDCVLLLDEADVFITHRVKVGDLQRNGLVSVFLRMLEYYNGILFLTTNRPGVLDEAVKSRVHLSLKYNHLTLSQTEALFEFNMQRLKEIEDRKGSIDPQYRKLHLRKKEIVAFAREHYEKAMAKQGVGRWNGRQIRNAFLIAASLAHYGDGEEGDAEEEELQKQLGRTHFEKVDKTTLLYDQYRREMFNRDDDSRAYEQEER